MDLHLGRSKNQNFSTSGRLIDAEEATPLVLKNNLVMHNPVIPNATKIANAFSDKPSVAYKRTKARFRKIALLGFSVKLSKTKLGHRRKYDSEDHFNFINSSDHRSRFTFIITHTEAPII